MKVVTFKRYGSNTLLGNFAPGDIARVGDSMAAHLVAELSVADYVESKAEPVAEREPAPVRRKGRK